VETGRWERAKLAYLRFSHGQTAAVLTLSLGLIRPEESLVPTSVNVPSAVIPAFPIARSFAM
jgi:hypothetical protein